MNMQDFFKHLAGHLGQDEEPLSNEVIQGFLRVLEDVRVKDMPCSQVFARLDEYVEREMHGEDAAQLMPLLREHFDICSDCCEEYETLLEILAKSVQQGSGPEA